MSRSSKTRGAATAIPQTTWRWVRRIQMQEQEAWLEKIAGFGFPWNVVERPGAKLAQLIVYLPNRAAGARLRIFGGSMDRLETRAWAAQRPAAPLVFGKRLRLVSAPAPPLSGIPQLLLPRGLAFGSGDHATTSLLLRGLAARRDWEGVRVLDLGTGSGVLALAARLFGAGRVAGIDFDPDAVRTARENEALNFSTASITWRCGDVRRLGPARHELVLANLFSNILIEAAPRIVRAVKPGGELWLSGILREQHAGVAVAYRRLGLRHLATVTRHKWEMQRWGAPTSRHRELVEGSAPG
jgi:ribosomal protein L11 methyltransferase